MPTRAAATEEEELVMENSGDEEDSDADAEGEAEEDSEADAEAEEDDDEDVGENVGAVKTRSLRQNRRKKVEVEEEDDSESVANEVDEDSDASESADEKDWEARDDDEDGDEIEIRIADADSRCIFCGQDEENDPSPDYEDFLACAVCGDNSHRSCARDNNSLASDEDAARWRCKECVANGLEEDFKNVPETLASRRGSSAPKMARDLLPAARGGIDPTSHSVFNTLILDEDPMDGSRSLRKRKTPSDDADDVPRPAIRKRQRTDAGDDDSRSAIDEGAAAVSGVDGADDVASQPSRADRPQRQKGRKRGARIVSTTEDPKSCIVAIAVSVAQWDEVEKQVQRKQRRRERDRIRRLRNARAQTGTVEVEEPQHFPAVQTTMYANPFYAFPDRDTEENKGRPYGGILTEGEADTARTYPQDPDRKAFQDARERAEQKWKEKMAKTNGETPARAKQAGPASKIKCINFGRYEIDTWHAAPYPEEYSRNKHLYICEFCLKYMSSDYVAWRHKLKCSAKHPPGDEIYRQAITNPETGNETTLSFWEVDGRRNPLYCQNLCLLAKLFLGSKTLYYDVEPFLFYIMTENDEFGCHFVGYFSKEKRGCPPPVPESALDNAAESQANGGAEHAPHEISLAPALQSPGNNVSCILVLPVHMRRGFGRVLIEFSYLLTKVEERTGSPEKPLSDMGLVSYRSYWRTVLCRLLQEYKGASNGTAQVSIADIAKDTGMTFDDIISTLEALRFLARDPVTKTYAMRLDYEYMKEYVDKHDKKATIQLNRDLLVWTPYETHKPTSFFAMGEETLTNQPMQTVAPRNEAVEEPSVQPIAPAPNGDEDNATDSIEDSADATPPVELSSKPSRSPSKLPTLTPQPSHTEPPPRRPSPRRTPAPASPSRLKTISPTRRTSPRKTPQPRSPSPPPTASSSRPSTSHTGPIPPTRFEIFPPLPGAVSAAKRRAGRPGSRRKTFGSPYRLGPVRRRPTGDRRSTTGGARAAARRTRSKLGEEVSATAEQVNENASAPPADEHGEDEEDGAGDGEHGEEDEEGGLEDAEGEEEILYD
ncbi:Histone acetyltransferase [Oleoguttula sp. CCFEE 5521]